jgi:ABC-type phosphate transport system substrate-binding protein
MTPRFLCFLLVVLALCGIGGSCSTSRHDEKVQLGSIHLHGAGATFPAPLYATWLAEYHKRHSEIHRRYDAVGSGAGILRFMAWAADFGASDVAMTDGDMGVMDAAEVQRFKRWEWWCEAVWLRRLDDAAKIPGLQVFGLEHYRSLLQALTRKGHRV